MDFTEAMKSLEDGKKIRRPEWEGYLFLDVDGNIKHAGTRGKDEKFWSLDTGKPDWEIKTTEEGEFEFPDPVEIETHEVTQARLEAMMDATACHIKRLYYLEEIISSQHKAMKSIADNFIVEMEETRRVLAKSASAVPRIEHEIKDLQNKFYKLDLCGMVKSYRQITSAAEEQKKEDEKSAKETEKKEKKENKEKIAENISKTDKKLKIVETQKEVEEKKEMEEVREKLNLRAELKKKAEKVRARNEKYRKKD